MYINGKWVSAKNNSVFSVFNPASGEKIGEVPNGDRQDAVIMKSAHHSVYYDVRNTYFVYTISTLKCSGLHVIQFGSVLLNYAPVIMLRDILIVLVRCRY